MLTVDRSTATRAVPLDWNGYATVAKRAVQIPAKEVRAGDVLLLADCVSLVGSVEKHDIQAPYGCDAYWIRGDINIIRFGHEQVSVLR